MAPSFNGHTSFVPSAVLEMKTNKLPTPGCAPPSLPHLGFVGTPVEEHSVARRVHHFIVVNVAIPGPETQADTILASLSFHFDRRMYACVNTQIHHKGWKAGNTVESGGGSALARCLRSKSMHIRSNI